MRGLIFTSAAALLAASFGAPALAQPTGAAGAREAPAARSPSRMEVAPGPVGRAPLPQQRPGIGDDLGPAPGVTGNPLLLAPNRPRGSQPVLRFGVAGAPDEFPGPGSADGGAAASAQGPLGDGAAGVEPPLQDPLRADPSLPGAEAEPWRGAPRPRPATPGLLADPPVTDPGVADPLATDPPAAGTAADPLTAPTPEIQPLRRQTPAAN